MGSGVVLVRPCRVSEKVKDVNSIGFWAGVSTKRHRSVDASNSGRKILYMTSMRKTVHPNLLL